ncbi:MULTISPECIES: hypothetical protein [unclassified Actinotalea]|uniref:hypothetical protein n=1 Tax=unclassified Actinotalea TaxID=2638618 RepID=UPI0015F7111F|nr:MULTISPECIES: hypothetical protein [unclassified Actinotalea]
MPTPETPPRFGARLLLAGVLTLWAGLHATTMLVAALRGGEPLDAMRWWSTGLVTAGLAAAAVWAWRRVATARGSGGPRPGTSDASGPTDAGRPRHRGFSGEIEPPRRW